MLFHSKTKALIDLGTSALGLGDQLVDSLDPLSCISVSVVGGEDESFKALPVKSGLRFGRLGSHTGALAHLQIDLEIQQLDQELSALIAFRSEEPGELSLG